MYRPVTLLHVVGCKEVQDTCKLEQKVVLEAKHGCGPDDSGLGENTPGHMLCSTLEHELDLTEMPR